MDKPGPTFVYIGVKGANKCRVYRFTPSVPGGSRNPAPTRSLSTPDRRSRGLASVVTSAVAGKLLARGIATIALNVRSDNHHAIRAYERLGFERYCEYQEAIVVQGLTVTV